ncbi:MAG: hypothetical protein ACPGSW_01115 [Phaeobacter italicus]
MDRIIVIDKLHKRCLLTPHWTAKRTRQARTVSQKLRPSRSSVARHAWYKLVDTVQKGPNLGHPVIVRKKLEKDLCMGVEPRSFLVATGKALCLVALEEPQGSFVARSASSGSDVQDRPLASAVAKTQQIDLIGAGDRPKPVLGQIGQTGKMGVLNSQHCWPQ